MFDIGWTELLVIAVVLIVVVGPKDLPPMIRAFGKMTANFRKMAGDFRAQFDEALREADMDDVRKTLTDAQKLNPTNALRDAINPLRQMGQDIKSDLQKATHIPNPLATNASPAEPADVEAQQAVEGAEPSSIASEIPASIEPVAAAPTTPVTAAAVGPVTPTATAATTKAAPEAVAVAKPRAPRKTPAKMAGEAQANVKPTKASAAPKATIGGTAVVAEKPKRVKAATKTVVEAASAALEPSAAKAPARKRAAKTTDTPKDEA